MKTNKRIKRGILLFLFLGFTSLIFSQNLEIKRQTIGLSGGSFTQNINGGNYLIQQSIGQASSIGIFTNAETELRQGFIQPFSIINFSRKIDHLELKIFPNPFTDFITIAFEKNLDDEIQVQLFDLLGRLVMDKKYYVFHQINIAIQKLPKGSYLIKIATIHQQFSTQIQKI
jgi:hypothetical protein